MDRRGFLKASAGALSATLGAFAARTGVGQPEVAQAGAQGQQVDATASLMSLSTQGEAHYAAPVGGIARTIVAGPFPDYDPDSPVFTYHASSDPTKSAVKTLRIEKRGDGTDLWHLDTIPATTLFRDTLTQSTPWTTEQMAKVRDEYGARPDVFRAVVSSPPREGDAYAVRVLYESGGSTP